MIRMDSRALLVMGLLLLGTIPAAHARPEFARKEGRACQYCHVNDSPGLADPITGKVQGTARNNRGIYYGEHNHSFKGYVQPETNEPKLEPLFRFLWKIDLLDQPRRVAVAEVNTDGKPRLITLHEKSGSKKSSVLKIRKWNGKEYDEEFTAALDTSADVLAVGRFAGEKKPAIILTENALFRWDGKTYVKRTDAHPKKIFGVSHMKSGEERVLVAESKTALRAFRVRPDAPGSYFIDGIEAPKPDQVTIERMSAAPEFFGDIGIPVELADGRNIGIWNTKADNQFLLAYIKLDRDLDVKADPKNPTNGKPEVTYKDVYSYINFIDPLKAGKLIWDSPRMKGEVYEVALGNPRQADEPGILVLTSESYSSKGRTLYYYAPQKIKTPE